MQAERLVLHGYWRSGTSYRTRIALNIKGLSYEQITHDLRKAEHQCEAYLALNPQGLVPALEAGETVLTQSGAIIEWLEERYPDPPLLPADPGSRAIVRAMALTIACDVHPLGNMRVLTHLRRDLGADNAQVQRWLETWMRAGFIALDAMIAHHGGRFAFGDRLTLADCHIVPQLYAAERFGIALDDFPYLRAAGENAAGEKAVRLAHPALQPDADRD